MATGMTYLAKRDLRRSGIKVTLRRALAATTCVAMSLIGGAAMSHAATAGTFYVDRTMSTCSDNGSGTVTAPFCTITKGVSKLTPGSILYVGNGAYGESIKPTVSGTSSAGLLITAWPGRSPVIGAGVADGVYVSGRSYITISDLTFTGTTGDGIYDPNSDHGIDYFSVTGGRLIGNTVFHNCTTGINVEGTSGSYLVANNIAVDNAVYPAYRGISCSRRNGNIGIWDSSPSSTTVDHNLVWLTKPGAMYVFKSSYTSLSSMQAATGQERAGVQADPKFMSTSTGDFRLTEGSPAIDRADSGVPGEQSADILGNPRVRDLNVTNTFAAGPRQYDDLGAYEFQPITSPPPAQPPTAALGATPTGGQAPTVVTANASASTDPCLLYTSDAADA